MNSLVMMAPLDKIQLPIHLNGSKGSNRVQLTRYQIMASNDIEAIKTWLAEYQKSEATYQCIEKKWSIYSYSQ